jgi:hypothetical protein
MRNEEINPLVSDALNVTAIAKHALVNRLLLPGEKTARAAFAEPGHATTPARGGLPFHYLDVATGACRGMGRVNHLTILAIFDRCSIACTVHRSTSSRIRTEHFGQIGRSHVLPLPTG